MQSVIVGMVQPAVEAIMGTPEPFALTGLTGREYKILLAPKHFPAEPKVAAKLLWSKLPEILGPHLSDSNALPKLPEGKPREIQFRDTDKLALDDQGYSLRLRRKGSSSEVTLKLRTGDILVSGSTSLPEPTDLDASKDEESEWKFEEDIAPLEVQTDKNGVAMPGKPGIRSRFSRSAGREKKALYKLERYGDAKALFPTLDESLREAGVVLDSDATLNPGAEIDEHVFKAEGIPLKDEVKITITATFWYFDRENPGAEEKPLGIVELSFQWDLPKLKMDDEDKASRLRGQARRAERLFLHGQKVLWSLIDTKSSSKTSVSLPKPR